MVRAIPVNGNTIALNKSPPAKGPTASPAKRSRGCPPQNSTITDQDTDSIAAVAPKASLSAFPPPPPPPPPPVDNPYYQKFVEQYWNKYDGSYTSLPPIPPLPSMTMGMPPPPAAVDTVPTKKSTTVQINGNLPPLSLEEEFPINTDRITYFIGNPAADSNVLSEKSCYIRTRLIEVFATLPTDNAHWQKGTKHINTDIGRIGLRCVYCASLPRDSRAERSVSFPSSISRMYHTVADMQHKHVETCTSIPPQVRQAINQSRCSVSNREKKTPPKLYWEVSAKELGMEDIEGDKAGVRLKDDHKLIAKSAAVINELFVDIGEERKSTNSGNKKRKASFGGSDSEEGEQKIEKADDEVENILANL